MRITNKEEWHLEIWPSLGSFLSFQKDTPEKWRQLEEQEITRIRAEIGRHVDGPCDISVKYKTVYACSFCGHEFSEDELATDESECCDEAIAESQAAHKEGE